MTTSKVYTTVLVVSSRLDCLNDAIATLAAAARRIGARAVDALIPAVHLAAVRAAKAFSAEATTLGAKPASGAVRRAAQRVAGGARPPLGASALAGGRVALAAVVTKVRTVD